MRPLIQVDLIYRDAKTGRITRRQRHHNTLTNYALAAVAQWLAGIANVPGGAGGVIGPNYVALGNGSGTPAPTDTALFAEVNGARLQASSRQQYQTYYAMIVGYFPTSVPQVKYTEAGLFDAAAYESGNLWAHVNLTNADLSSGGETLTVQWKILVSGN